MHPMIQRDKHKKNLLLQYVVADFFLGGCAFAFLVIWVDGTLCSSGISGTRCFSGGIVFVDIIEVLDASLFRFFSLTTERVSFTL